MSTNTDATPTEDASTSVITAARLTSDFTGEVIRINVSDGRDSVSCQVHKQLLQQKSPYFAALPNFLEGTENEVSLDGISPNAFQNLVHWFYRDRLDPQTKKDPKILAETWIAADRLLMNRCKNVAVDKLQRYYKIKHSEAMILEVVEALENSPGVTLVQYLTDQIAYDCVANANEENTGMTDFNWPPSIPVNLALILTRKIIAVAQQWRGIILYQSERPMDPSESLGCIYHDHIEGEECHLKQKT